MTIIIITTMIIIIIKIIIQIFIQDKSFKQKYC